MENFWIVLVSAIACILLYGFAIKPGVRWLYWTIAGRLYGIKSVKEEDFEELK